MINEKPYDWLFTDFWRYATPFVFGLFGVRQVMSPPLYYFIFVLSKLVLVKRF